MSEQPRPTDIEAPEIEPQDRFIAPQQPEDQAQRLDDVEPDPALEEGEDDPASEPGPEPAGDKVDRESEQSFPASDPPSY